MGYYYPTYIPPNLNITPQGVSYSTSVQQPYYPMMNNMDPQMFMNQFAQFMTMMGNSMGMTQPVQSEPVIKQSFY